jgi:hypothetical protein
VNKKRVKRAFTDGETIRDLLRAVEQWQLKKEKPGEGIMAAAKELARQWKKKKQSLFAGYDNNLIQLLAALVVALRPYYEVASSEATLRDMTTYLESKERAKLSDAERELLDALRPPRRLLTREQKRRQKYERRRHAWHRNARNSIEYQFGGGKEEPTCLEDIFADRPVNMIRLEDLFQKERHQLLALHYKAFKHKLPCVERGWYGPPAVLEIFEALLKPQRRKRTGRKKRIWLENSSLRLQVLRAIETRIKSVPNVPTKIARAFLSLIHRYLQCVGEK